MTRVKICGITNLEDALRSVELGADELGFNFYRDSPRYIEAAACGNITAQVQRNILKVGVFVNEAVDEVCRVSELAGLDAVQLHGDEPPDYVAELRPRTKCRLIKAVRVANGFDPSDVLNYDTDSILLDVDSAGRYGGTGEAFDWSLAKGVKKMVADLYLAGGLTALNVSAAIGTVGPNAVDIASGVELTPGRKDPEKIKAFIAAVKST
jgi:phosphoribosylanthranilate isomerase